MKDSTPGFTLIELLVVVAIIGLLASIVLVSLSSARAKGRDARIMTDVQQIRAAIESGFNGYGYPDLISTNANCYSSTAITSNNATNANCVNSSGTYLQIIQLQVQDANNQGGANSIFFIPGVVGSKVTSFAIRGRLVASPTNFFCLDSSGKANPSDTSVVIAANCN